MDKKKHTYHKPELKIHGNLKNITKKGYGPTDDNNIGSQNDPFGS